MKVSKNIASVHAGGGCPLLQEKVPDHGAGRLCAVPVSALHLALGGSKKVKSSIVYRSTFSGSMRIKSKKVLPTDVDEARKMELLATGMRNIFTQHHF